MYALRINIKPIKPQPHHQYLLEIKYDGMGSVQRCFFLFRVFIYLTMPINVYTAQTNAHAHAARHTRTMNKKYLNSHIIHTHTADTANTLHVIIIIID